MIGELFIDLLTGFAKFAVSLFPTSEPPSWLRNAGGALRQVWGYAAGLGAWIPWTVVGTIVAAVFACMVLGLTIKLARIVLSLFTAGGGSAA